MMKHHQVGTLEREHRIRADTDVRGGGYRGESGLYRCDAGKCLKGSIQAVPFTGCGGLPPVMFRPGAWIACLCANGACHRPVI
ncbi:hypothetical protein [Escherichia fergusonii]|uniref:hypothetical protein n=2 Tax=Escherichia fergusonii TaxID=564 RepID=UPI002FD4BE86